MIVLTVSKESMVPEVRAKPNFVVTNPKVINTSGDIKIRARNHGEVNLSSLLAQTALRELADSAINTAIII